MRFKALPGTEGDIWLAGGASDGAYGLWHSTDGGQSFTELRGVDEADTIGFGKAAPSTSYQTLFTSAKIDKVRGIFRSTNRGESWTRINDDAHQWGWTGAAITGDPRVYGRVYVAANGRGIVYGDTSGTEGGDDGGGTDPGRENPPGLPLPAREFTRPRTTTASSTPAVGRPGPGGGGPGRGGRRGRWRSRRRADRRGAG